MQTYANNIKNIYFDITSFTFNLVSIKESYKRLDNEFNESNESNNENITFYDICKKCPDSLLNKVKTNLSTDRLKKDDDQEHNWISRVSIRNVEVLQDFITHLQNNRPKGNNSDYIVIQNFFQNASDYAIKTYDNDEANYREISFPFLNLLDEQDEDKPVVALFDMIFNNTSNFFELDISFYKNDKNYNKTAIWNNMCNIKNNKPVNLKNNPAVKQIFDQHFKDNKAYSPKEREDLLSEVKKQVDDLEIPLFDKH